VPSVVYKKLNNAKKVGVLPLAELKLKELPAVIFEIAPRTADVSKNLLKHLPAELEAWAPKLQIFLASSNKIRSIDPSFGSLTKLTKLDLGGNELAGVPSFFSSLSALKELHLASNQLGSLEGVNWGSMTALSFLDVSNNKISSLTAFASTGGAAVKADSGSVLTDIPLHGDREERTQVQNGDIERRNLTAHPPSLSDLRVRNNCLQALEGVEGISTLTVLDVSGNKNVSVVPPRLLTDTNLNDLNLRECRIERKALMETEGFESFQERRKARIDKKIDSKLSGLDFNLCGLED